MTGATGRDMSKRSTCPGIEQLGRALVVAWVLAWAAIAGADDLGCTDVEYQDGLWIVSRTVETEHGLWAVLATEPTAHYPAVSRRQDPEHVAWIAKRQRGSDEIYIAGMQGHRIGKGPRRVSLASSSSPLSGLMPVRFRELLWSPQGSLLLVSSTHRGENTVRILDVTSDVREPAEREPFDDGVWRSDFAFLDEQRLAFKRRTDDGEALVIRRIGEGRGELVVAGDVHDLTYSKEFRALFYRKYDVQQNVGLYMWRLDGSGETTLLNPHGSSQAFPRVSEDFAGLLAFVSNYRRQVTDLAGRSDQQRYWRIYVEDVERLARIQATGAYDSLKSKTSRLLEDHQYLDPELQKRNALIWHGSSIYFQPQDSSSQIVELRPTSGEQALWCVPQELPISIQVSASRQQPAKLRLPAIGSFDVFTSSGETFAVASTRMTEENAGHLTTLFVFRLGR